MKFRYKYQKKWKFDTIDYIDSLKMYGLDMKYIHINNLPKTKKEWTKIIEKRYRQIHKNEMDEFLMKNGEIINQFINLNELRNTSLIKPFKNLIKYIEEIYQKEETTTNEIRNTINYILDTTKLNWINKERKMKDENDKTIIRYCPLCNKIRVKNMTIHLIYDCEIIKKMNLNKKMWIGNTNNTKNQNNLNKIEFIKQMKQKIDIKLEEIINKKKEIRKKRKK